MDLALKAEDILYCNIDKLGFYFNSSQLFWYFKYQDPFTDRKEVIQIWNEKLEFKVYLTKEGLNGYDKKVWFKIEFCEKWYEVIDIFFNENAERALCVFHWKLWRLSFLADFEFSNDNLIDFILEKFTEITLREIHICMDIEKDIDYLTRVDAELRRTAPYLKKKRRADDKEEYYTFDRGKYWKHILIWNESNKDNKEYYYRIYNKTNQVRDDGIEDFYLDYFNEYKSIFRYEIELRQNIAKRIDINDLRTKLGNSWKYAVSEWIFWVLASYFKVKKKFGFVFWKLEFKDIKLKRADNKITGSVGKKIDTFHLLPQLKSIKTQAQNIENKTGIPIKDNLDKIDEVIGESKDYIYYLTLYKWIFRTLQNHYENNRVNNFDELTEVIKGATNYTLTFLKTDYNTFFKIIRGWINKNAESVIEFLSDNDNSLMEMIYFYYFWWLREWIIFDFLDVLREWNLPIFENYFEDHKKYKEILEKKQKEIQFKTNKGEASFEEYATTVYQIVYS